MKKHEILSPQSRTALFDPPTDAGAIVRHYTFSLDDMALIRQLHAPEYAVLPIGDHFTMGPREAALACRLLKAKKVIPMHFGTFPALTGKPEELAKLLKDFPQTKVWPLEIGTPAKW